MTFFKKLGVKIRKIREMQIVSVYGIFPKNLNGISKNVKDEFAFNLKISIYNHCILLKQRAIFPIVMATLTIIRYSSDS